MTLRWSSDKYISTMEYIWTYVCTIFINLTHLIFYELLYTNIYILHTIPLTFSSSTLVVLKIKVKTFDSCPALLDDPVFINFIHFIFI